MAVTCVVGSMWGDEGKGKIIDYLANKADMVIRAQGGNNAGHTIVKDGTKYALHLMPSGVIRPSCKNILGSGMAVDPQSFLEEIRDLNKKGLNTTNIYLSSRAHVLMPYHRLLDKLKEDEREEKIGTTHKGIGPCYSEKVSRDGIRFCDFVCANNDYHIRKSVEKNAKFIGELYSVQLDKEQMISELLEIAELIKPYVCDTVNLVYESLDNSEDILLEGAQGSLLDVTYGTYPFVTSSNPISGGFSVGSGVPANKIDRVIAVVKAYTTRVGEGPFVTELFGEIADDLRTKGNEFGTTTGRPRRIGWLDAVALKYSAKINGTTEIALTLLDVLSGRDKIKICVGYEYEGEKLDYFPAGMDVMAKALPIYEEMDGFSEDITQVTSFEELPKEAIAYVKRIEELLSIPVSIVSVGPDRKQTFFR